jgi:hypothetical protein
METYVGYGWRGLERDDYWMALHYSLRAVGQVPWRAGGWWLLARLLRRLLVRGLLRRSPRAQADDVEP